MVQRSTDSGRTYDPKVVDREWQLPEKIELTEVGSIPTCFPWEIADSWPTHWWRGQGLAQFRTERLAGRAQRDALGGLCLRWSERTPDEQASYVGYVDSTREVLDDLARLGEPEPEPERFLRFARRYGPLRLCDLHGAPFTECQLHHKALLADGGDPQFCSMLRPEPIAIWYAYARHVRGALLLADTVQRTPLEARHAKAVQRERDELAADMLGESVETFRAKTGPRPTSHHGHLLHEVASRWTRLLRPTISRTGDADLRFEFEGHGLLGAIAKHLVFSLVRGSGLAVCYYCAETYEPIRKPISGKRNFCKRCRDNKVPQLLASRDKRERDRAE